MFRDKTSSGTRVRIAPSVLAADLGILSTEVNRAIEGGCDAFHIDIMDWHFVPNLSFGPNIVQTMRKLTDLPLDVHLMVDDPLVMIGPFADAGSDIITIHVESPVGTEEALDSILQRRIPCGISLKPDTPVEALYPFISAVDLILVMSVFPGFGGQKFIEETYARLKAVSETAKKINPNMVISVDGGVNVSNAPKLAAAGANLLIAGTAIFGGGKAVRNLAAMKDAVSRNRHLLM